MSVIRDLLGLPERRNSIDLLNTEGDHWTSFRGWGAIFNGNKTHSGKLITPKSALAITAFYNGVEQIAGTIGSCKFELKRRLKDGSIEDATDEPLYWLCKGQVNKESNAFTFFETLTGHALVGGNAFAQIIRSRGEVKRLNILQPEQVEPRRVRGELVYIVRDDSGMNPEAHFLGDSLLHFFKFSRNGVEGISPISLHRETFGTVQGQNEYQARLYTQGTHARAVLETEKEMKKEQVKEFTQQWQENWGGTHNAHLTPVLHSGIKYRGVSLSVADLDYVRTAQLNERHIAQILNISLHMLKDDSRATFNNMEQLQEEYRQHTIRPWAIRWEEFLNHQLLTKSQREAGLFFKQNLDAIVRGSLKEEAESFGTYLDKGVLSINEVRAKKDWNRIEGGDQHRVPLNMEALGANPSENSAKRDAEMQLQARNWDNHAKSVRKLQDSGEIDSEDARFFLSRAESALEKLLRDGVDRVQNREVKTVQTQVVRLKAKDFEGWLERFYEEHGKYSRLQLLPLVVAVANLYDVDEREAAKVLDMYLSADFEASKADIRALFEECANGATDDQAVWSAFLRKVPGMALTWTANGMTERLWEGVRTKVRG